MAEPMKWRMTQLGRIWIHPETGDLVIQGTEKHRGTVGITISAAEVRWLMANLEGLNLGKAAGQSKGAYVVESLSSPS